MSRWASAIASLAVVVTAAGPAGAATSDARFRDAIRGRDLVAVQGLIKQGANVNLPSADGATPLHWAVNIDDLRFVEALLQAGAKADSANTYGITPLMLACENGNAAVIQRLLKAGANPNATMASGETALMTAARTGKPEAVAAMLAGGANVNAKESLKGQTALMWALSGPHVEAAKVLVEKGADIHARSNAGFTPLMFAVRYNSMDAAKFLLDRGAKLDEQAKDGATPLVVAVLRGHVPLAKWLLEKGANPNADATGYTALHFAAGKWDGVDSHDYLDAPGEWNILLGLKPADKLEMIKALIKHGADPNPILKREPPRYGFSLVSGSAKMYTSGSTPFFIAAMSADTEVMRLLVASGADPRIPSKNGTTPLMAAAGMIWMENETLTTEKEYLAATKLCLDLGVDANAVNTMGNSALHGTISGGFNDVIGVLVQGGANVNIKNRRGDTPLKMALGYSAAGGNHVREDTAAVLRKVGATD